MRRTSEVSGASKVSIRLQHSQSRVSNISKLSRVSSFSNITDFMTPNKTKPLVGQLPSSSSNAVLKTKINPALPPKPNIRPSPYYSQQEQIYCVICKKSYLPSDLSTHLEHHKQRNMSPAKMRPPSSHLLPSQSQSIFFHPKNKSIQKMKQVPYNSSKIKTFSIADMIPANQKTSPPIPQPIFQPDHLGLSQSQLFSYEEQYLNPEMFSSRKGFKKNDNDLESLFDSVSASSFKGKQNNYIKSKNPVVIYDKDSKWTDNRKTDVSIRLSSIAKVSSVIKKVAVPY